MRGYENGFNSFTVLEFLLDIWQRRYHRRLVNSCRSQLEQTLPRSRWGWIDLAFCRCESPGNCIHSVSNVNQMPRY
jgi:hypothetical protein